MIELLNLTKSFNKFCALKNITLTLNAGQSISLIGPNGSGKTTLIKCILGMVVPSEGEILYKGNSVKQNSIYRSDIGYMPQIGRYPDNMTIAEIFALMKELRKDVTTYDEELYEAYAIDEIKQKKMRTLSGGTRQKVSACLAFLFSPEVFILDEPTAGLDPLATEILKQKIIKERGNGKLFLITSHILSDLDEIVSDVAYLYDGNLKFIKSLEQLKHDTGEVQLSKAIASIMKDGIHE